MTRPVRIDPRAAAAWPALRGIAYALPGTCIVGPVGEHLLVRDDGGVEEVNAVPARWSISADPTATRSAA